MKSTDLLSQHFSYAESIASETADRLHISNTPDEAVLEVMKQTALGMERVRSYLSSPIHINSWYRSLALNRSLGSKDSSQHRTGEAVDFISPNYGTPTYIVHRLSLIPETIQFDQLILEHSWVHISFAILNSKPRNQVLSLIQGGHYATGITDIAGNPIKF